MIVKEKKRAIFGTDGVRGRANYYPMTVEVALSLGRACGMLIRSSGKRERVVVGKDTRLSCYMYENALIAGLCSMGVDTLMVGPLPTPGVAFITRAYRADAGIVISASHNPFGDNGIKFFSAEGFKLDDAWEHKVEALVQSRDFENALPPDAEIGKNTKVIDADGRYIEFAKGTFPRKSSLQGFKVALDCANGAAWRVAPLIFRELDAEVFELGTAPNGLNINAQCGALFPESVRQVVLQNGADIGIALDGDADRVILVDEEGNVVDGDVILAICAKEMAEKGQLKQNCVVSTVMANLGFDEAMQKLGIEVVRAQVGDRYVIQEMLEHGVNLGGEQSGHLIFLDYNTTGDGLVGALQVLRIMKEKGAKLSQLASLVTLYPQVCVNVAVTSKPNLEEIKPVVSAIDTVKKALSEKGRVLVRYSGTEMICRVMVEGEERESVEKMVASIVEVVKREIGV